MKNIDILRNKKIDAVKPQILSKKNGNLYTNISNYFENQEYTRKDISQDKKKIIEMYGNILLFHDAINNDSVLKDKFINNNSNAIALLKKQRAKLKVSSKILATSIDIDISIQNHIANDKVPLLPKSTTRDDCLQVLEILYDQYKWDKTEYDGRNPTIGNKNRLIYYSILMESWIHSKPLKIIIQNTINYYYNNGDEKNIYIRQEDGKMTPFKFDRQNDFHINKLINDVVWDIENILRFKIKNYISNYQALLKQKYDFNYQMGDWESYIEYGTTDGETIEIQNLGFPRNIAIFLRDNYPEAFIKNELGAIYDIDEQYLINNIDKEKFKFDYEELALFMDWKINE